MASDTAVSTATSTSTGKPATRSARRAVPGLARLGERARFGVRWGLGHGLPGLLAGRVAKQGDLQGRLLDRTISADPERLHALTDEIRAAGTIHRARYAHVTASHAAVKEILTSPDFRSEVFQPGEGLMGRLIRWADEPERIGPLQPPSLLVVEPPSHTRYRKLVTRVFTVRAVQELAGRTQEIAEELLDRIEAAGSTDRVDLVEAYCAQLPLTVIAEILGVPPEDRQKVLEFGTAAAPSLDLGLSVRELASVEQGLDEFRSWLLVHLDRLRENPGPDLMSKLVAVQDEDGGLTQEELLATAGLVLAAGFETTVNLLGNGIALLDAHPDQRARLREDPSLWGNAVDEVLRFDPPVLLTGRVANEPIEVLGHRIGRGEIVSTVLAGANRDPEVFTDPHTFDVARENARDHVSFSAGRHYCLGAALARMEGEVGLRTLFERFPDLAVLPGAERRPTRILRGFEHLPVRLT